ncbi:MAG: hypothetical protein E6I80_17070 [Chloroflexi bacterium]|nr:MAG: hypothetical protein E6I80_17070 [Chloroflexota bacterium]
MGVERAVTRWHIQQQQIQQEITTLEAKLALLSSCPSEASGGVGSTDRCRAATDEQETDSIRQQLTDAQKKLLALGPCPKPMMG